MKALWSCPACCNRQCIPYRLPVDGDVRCASCRAPLTADDLQPHWLTDVDLTLVPDPPPEAEEGSGLRHLNEELRRLNTELDELRLTLLGPSPSALPLPVAASLLGCGRTQIFSYLKAGKLRRAKRLGRQVMITVASIESLMQSTAPEAAPSQLPKLARTTLKAARASRGIRALPLTGLD